MGRKRHRVKGTWGGAGSKHPWTLYTPSADQQFLAWTISDGNSIFKIWLSQGTLDRPEHLDYGDMNTASLIGAGLAAAVSAAVLSMARLRNHTW